MERARAMLLYADDNADDRTLVKHGLEESFPDVDLHCVADGEAVLAYMRAAVGGEHRLPHVVLLDLSMPRKSGLAVLAELKADTVLQRIPVVIVAASRRPSDPDNALRLGAAAFYSKPRSRAELLEVLTELSSFWANGPGDLALAG